MTRFLKYWIAKRRILKKHFVQNYTPGSNYIVNMISTYVVGRRQLSNYPMPALVDSKDRSQALVKRLALKLLNSLPVTL